MSGLQITGWAILAYFVISPFYLGNWNQLGYWVTVFIGFCIVNVIYTAMVLPFRQAAEIQAQQAAIEARSRALQDAYNTEMLSEIHKRRG